MNKNNRMVLVGDSAKSVLEIIVIKELVLPRIKILGYGGDDSLIDLVHHISKLFMTMERIRKECLDVREIYNDTPWPLVEYPSPLNYNSGKSQYDISCQVFRVVRKTYKNLCVRLGAKIDTTWYTNDHSFVKGPDRKWHAYGIIGHAPINPWTGEDKFFHISSEDIFADKWEDHDYALRAKEGVERVLWAPHIYEEDGWYTMFYNAGNLQENAANYASWGTLHKATSRDMFNWERHEFNPLFSDPGHARDSYVMKHKGEYYFYYTRTFSEVDLRSSVAVRKGPDTDYWSGPKIAHVQPYEIDWGGDAESPTVIYKDGLFYLFICLAMTEYNLTHVYWSDDPMNFPRENLLTTIDAHAVEVIEDNGQWYISNTGWDKKGLFLSRLEWVKR